VFVGNSGGEYGQTVRVTLRHPDAQATLRYTTDGTVPGKTAAIYTGPVELPLPLTFRARAFRNGWTRSVTVQETFVRRAP
jgi:hypothetical protein